MNKELKTNKEFSKLEKGIRRYIRIHPWVSKRDGRKIIARTITQWMCIPIVAVVLFLVIGV